MAIHLTSGKGFSPKLGFTAFSEVRHVMAECSKMEAQDQEREIVRAFFTPEKRPRYLGLLSTAKGRKKFIARLAHSAPLDPHFVHLIDPQEQTIDAIEDQLRERGAPPTCYVISEDPRLDRRRMPLRGTLEATVGSGMATILSCIVGRLAYFEGEEPGARYLCERASLDR
jgi:hypothetical protein